jgi:hypothetical protein
LQERVEVVLLRGELLQQKRSILFSVFSGNYFRVLIPTCFRHHFLEASIVALSIPNRETETQASLPVRPAELHSAVSKERFHF